MGETIQHGKGSGRGGGGRWGGRDDIHATPDVSYISNPDVAHEHSDVHVKPIARFVIALFIFGVAVHLLMWGLFKYFEKRERTSEPQASPLARKGAERLPPEPRLQLAPGFGVTLDDGRRLDLSAVGKGQPELRQPQAEYWEVRKEWDEELRSYGWADRDAGAVRLPIEDAKKLLLKHEAEKAQAAPSPSPQQQQQQGMRETLPQDSSSGQTQEKRNQ